MSDPSEPTRSTDHDPRSEHGGATVDTSNPEPMMHQMLVLDTGEPARWVAAHLGLDTFTRIPQPGDRPLVVVISEAAEVEALAEVEDRSWIGCAVAWRLPERALKRLYELRLSVLVGRPTTAEVITAYEYPPDEAQLSADRSTASRLETIEALLGDG